MSQTHLSGLDVGGVPVLPGMGGLGIVAFRKVYFVDGTFGNDSNTGLSVEEAYATVQAACDVVRDQDTIIVMRGSYDERIQTGQVIGTSDMVDGRGRYCTLVGASPTMWAYDSPQLYNVNDSTASLEIRSPGWRISGFRIVGDASSPICLRAEMAQGAATAGTSWAPGLQVDNVVFYGAVGDCIGLELTAVGDARVLNCRFEQFKTSGKEALTDGAGGFTWVNVRVEHCSFEDSKDNIVLGGQKCAIIGCLVGMNHNYALAKGIDLRSGGNSNGVHGCHLDGLFRNFANSGFYDGGAADDWAGNFSMDTGAASVGDNGITVAIPGAT
jgi:hypothetical protein